MERQVILNNSRRNVEIYWQKKKKERELEKKTTDVAGKKKAMKGNVIRWECARKENHR